MFTNNPDNPFAILPVAYAGKVSYGKGAHKGPAAILEACHQLEYFDIYTRARPVDAGITLFDEITATTDDNLVEAVERHFARHKQFTILLGGDHSTSIGAIRTLIATHNNLSVLQLDAHPDLFYSWNGSQNNHRCFGWHASHAKTLVQIGLRSIDEDELNFAQNTPTVIQSFAHQDTDIAEILNQLTDNVYISIDADVFDPSFIRNTGTPEPGGLSWNAVLEILQEVFANRTVIGCDIVEFAPQGNDPENYRAESYALAKLMYTLFGMKTKQMQAIDTETENVYDT